MPDAISTAAPASTWGGFFSNLLNTVVDTGAKVAVAKLDAKQAETASEQKAAATVAQANATAAKSAAETAAESAANWQKIAMYGGAAVLALVAVVILARKR